MGQEVRGDGGGGVAASPRKEIFELWARCSPGKIDVSKTKLNVKQLSEDDWER